MLYTPKLLLVLFYIFLFWQFCTLFTYCLVRRPFFSIFLCFSSIFDWFFLFSFSFPFLFFIFLFFFFQCTSLTQGKRSFSWRIFQLFLPRVRWEISILGQGYGQKVDVWLKRPTNGGTWFMSDICLANGSGIRECPDYFHENAYYDN